MKKRYYIDLTEDQKNRLKQKTEEIGFATISDYVRFILFMENSFLVKIDQIHKEVCKDALRES
jgi:hypothetical protein